MANKINKLSLRKEQANNVVARAEGDVSGIICYIYDGLTTVETFETIFINKCETDKGDACLTKGWGNCDPEDFFTYTCPLLSVDCLPKTEDPCPIETIAPQGCPTDPDYTDYCEFTTKPDGYNCWKTATCIVSDLGNGCPTDTQPFTCWCDITYGETCDRCTSPAACQTTTCTKSPKCTPITDTCGTQACYTYGCTQTPECMTVLNTCYVQGCATNECGTAVCNTNTCDADTRTCNTQLGTMCAECLTEEGCPTIAGCKTQANTCGQVCETQNECL